MVGTREMVLGFFLAVRSMFLRRGTSLRSGHLPLPWIILRVDQRGRGLRVGVFGGFVVEVIVGEGAAGGERTISTGEVSRNTNRKKAVTPYDL